MFVILVRTRGVSSLTGYRTVACLHLTIKLCIISGFSGQDFQDCYLYFRNLTVNKSLLLSEF